MHRGFFSRFLIIALTLVPCMAIFSGCGNDGNDTNDTKTDAQTGIKDTEAPNVTEAPETSEIPETTPITVKVMSYNVLNDVAKTNIDQYIAVIGDYEPDVIGFQEIKPDINEMLNERLKEKYAYVYEGRDNESGEGTPLYYNKDKYELEESGTRWISDTPDTMSKYDESAYTRIYTYAVLKEKNTGIKFVAINTHLDYVETANFKQIMKLVELTGKFGSVPRFYTADWNTDFTGSRHDIMKRSGLEDAAVLAKEAHKGPTCGDITIDFIFVSKDNTDVTKYKTIDDHRYSATSSDHKPIYAELVIGK